MLKENLSVGGKKAGRGRPSEQGLAILPKAINTREQAEKLAEALKPMAKENLKTPTGAKNKMTLPILAKSIDTREQAEKLAEAMQPMAKEKQLAGLKKGKSRFDNIDKTEQINTREQAERLAEALRPMAKEKQKAHGNTAPGRKNTSANIGKSDPIDTRAQAAKEAGNLTSP